MKTPLISAAIARQLIRHHGSPLYVYKKSTVAQQYASLQRSITYPRTRIFYACKANSNIEVLKALKWLGASVECVSRGEVERALAAGFPRQRIAYTCSNISRDELAWVMRKGISVHLDSLTQVQWWGEMQPNSSVSIRLNRGFGAGSHCHIITGGPESKFGIFYTDVPRVKALAERYSLKIVGLQQHIGSNILDARTFVLAMRLLLRSARSFPDLEYLDFGGGFGIPYRTVEQPLAVRTLGRSMSKLLAEFCRSYGRPLELRIEPGRYLVAEAGAFIATVNDIKRTPRHIFVGVDSGMNHLIRPALYDAYHEIFNLSRPSAGKVKVEIVGNICESGDAFARRRRIPTPRIGDILLFADVGAYGYVMSSDYNLRARPKEVVIP